MVKSTCWRPTDGKDRHLGGEELVKSTERGQGRLCRVSKRRFNLVGMFGALMILLPLLAACSVPVSLPLRRYTVTLSPSDLSNHYWNDFYKYETIGCGFHSTRLTSPPAGRLLVGADNDFEGGSGPLPCIRKDDLAYRGGVRFDVSGYRNLKRKVVEKATLSWTVESATVRDAAGNRRGVASGPDVTNCVGALLESKKSIFTEGEFLPGYPYRSGQGDVTSLVTSWIVNGDPNYGFVLVGLDESYSRNDAACLNTIGNLKLTITYLGE
jgi:hypothetical protein